MEFLFAVLFFVFGAVVLYYGVIILFFPSSSPKRQAILQRTRERMRAYNKHR